MPRTPANHLPSNDDEEEEESIEEEEEEEEEVPEEDEEEEVDEEVVEEEEEPQQQSNRVKDEDEEEDDEASPTEGLTAITPTRSSKRVASPVDVDHINPKRLKNHHDDHSKSSSQQRTTWTLEDELVLLNGIIDFKKSHNLDPFSDMDAFFHSIMHSLRLQVSTQQLKRKIRALKDKFNTYAIRPTKNAKPNHSQVYNLSMKIWGQNQDEEEEEEDDDEDDEDDIIATKRTPQQQRDKNNNNNNSTAFLVSPQVNQHHQISPSHYPYLTESFHSSKNWTGGGVPGLGLGLGETLAKEGIALIQKSKAEDLNRRFRMHQIQETEIYLNRIALICDQTKLILDALKSSI